MVVEWRHQGSSWRPGEVAEDPTHPSTTVQVFSYVECRDACKGERVTVPWADIRPVPPI